MRDVSDTPERNPRPAPAWKPLDARQRRVLGVLIEKAKTTPAAYPMTVNAIVTGCNQKNNRDPVTAYDDFGVEKALDELRTLGAVSEIDWLGRAAKYKHHAYEWLGVSKAELAVLAELMLRGAQALGELRARAARMEPIADLAALKPIVDALLERGLMIALTPPGRGQIVSHGLYPAEELAALRAQVAGHHAGPAETGHVARPRAPSPAASDVLAAIGNTPLVRLQRVVPKGSARVVAKLESANPTGSMKDRMARAAIEAAAAGGSLAPGGTVVEYTGGSTGVSLALVCAARGYGLEIVTSDAFSEEKRRTMSALGARLTLVPSEQGRITAALIQALIATAREISARPGVFWTDQLNNHDAATGYHALGEELWTQTGGAIDAFVQVVGSAHSIHGTAHALRAHRPSLAVIAVEPAESAVLSGGPSGSHRIEGIGLGFVPPLWHPDQVDEILAVTTDEAKAMARRLAREEGIFAGTSTGANVVAALRVAARLGPAATVATLIVDSGAKYLSTDLFREG